MSEYRRDLRRLPHSDDDLERQLALYGPLMGEQEQAEAELRPVFAAQLRAHLVAGQELAPHPTFARELRAQLLRRRRARPIPQPRETPWRRWIGTSAHATAALLVVMLVGRSHGSHTRTSAFPPPYPRQADLAFNFPSVPAALHRFLPTVSLVHPTSGIPYAGHLHLTAPFLPHEPSSLPAYRLALPSGVVVRGRRLLHISSLVRQVMTGTTTWLVAVDGGGPAHRPLHSLALSTHTGELIYHDRRNFLLSRARHPVNQTRAVAIARTWLTRFGWPGHHMPLRFFSQVPNRPKVRAVIFSWPQVGVTATAAATLWVTPNGSVIEAWVWPPIVLQGMIGARPITAAWKEVRRGTLPLAVEGISPRTRADGVGTLHQTQVVSILSSRGDGALYLIPTYRFMGGAHILGVSRAWYSLAPSAPR